MLSVHLCLTVHRQSAFPLLP